MTNSFSKIGVLGCGLMGSGIAEICARRGGDVIVVEANAEFAEKGLARIMKSMEGAVSRGKLAAEEFDKARANLRVVHDWSELSDREIVIEAISEDPEIKVDAFVRLDETLPKMRSWLRTPLLFPS